MEYKKLAESMSDSSKIARYFGERILLTSGSEAIKDLLSTVEELEAKNNRLEQARENANAACAKWEGLYRAELEKKGTWVSVKDRLPEDYQRVLCLFESGTMEVSFRASVKGFCYEGFKQTGKVTHWMPLPEPPKEGRSWESQ